jgi:hypothetical protein
MDLSQILTDGSLFIGLSGAAFTAYRLFFGRKPHPNEDGPAHDAAYAAAQAAKDAFLKENLR